MKKFLKVIRILWITFGALFIVWMANAFRAQSVDPVLLKSDSKITFEETAKSIMFRPNASSQPVGLIFFPGGMVQPEAYAPLLRTIAEQGYTVFMVKLPFGSAPLESQEADVMDQALTIMSVNGSIQHWVVAGHSRGAAIASRFAFKYGDAFDGLILIATSHPKDVALDLSNTTLSVTKIYASNDGLASKNEVEANAIYLPDTTTWVVIEGGNHSQFGYYGSQLGDGTATISRETQQTLTAEAVLTALNQVQTK